VVTVAKLRFTAVGDCIITKQHSKSLEPAFLSIIDKIRGSDVAFANLEIMTPRQPIIPSSESGGGYSGAPEFVLDELKWMGFNLYNVANNHSGDFTSKGLMDTIDALKERGMTYAGGGETLGLARSPGLLDSSAGRAAVVGAAASYTVGSQAGNSRVDFPGRPGLSNLRVERDFVLPAEDYEWLKKVDEKLGTAWATEIAKKFDFQPGTFKEGAIKFLGFDFYQGEKAELRQKPNEKDVADICKWITDARRQADFVVMSLHAHNGKNGAGNNPEMAEFLPAFAHACIDAGADAFVGHGPHMLRPVEVYKGKPIFYSLGNFLFEYDSIAKHPADQYEKLKLGPDSTPADIFDSWTKYPDGRPKSFMNDNRFYQTVLPVCDFSDGDLTEMLLYPLTLGKDLGPTKRGAPLLAGADEGREILANLAELSEPFGVLIEVVPDGDKVIGRATWKQG
jgi:hypothetical protein